MDITRGEFKDFSVSQRSSRLGSRLSSRGSTTGSLELLSPELITSQTPQNNKPPSEDDDSEYFSAEDEDANLSHDSTRKKPLKGENKEQASPRSSFCSSNSSRPTTEEPDAEDYEMQEAIKKMKKLDRILLKKIKWEKQVKRQRLLYQKSFHEDLALLKGEHGSTYSDAESNTFKYLSLMPPPQQLDVLLEKHEESNDFEPIFQTQFQLHGSSVGDSFRPKSADDLREDKKLMSDHHKKPASATHRQETAKANKDTDFIQRNIELNYVSMTKEEKERLSVLLEDIDEADLELMESPSDLAPMPSGEGYLPGQDELKRLQQIDDRLQILLTPDVYRSISSTPRSKQQIQNLMHANVELGMKFSKADLTEARKPSERLQDVEERLAKLDEKWKDQYNLSGPRLTDEQLYQLLAECSRTTSPDSLTTSLDSRLWNYDDDVTVTSSPSRLSSVTLHSGANSEQETEGRELATQDVGSLSRETLDELLEDARSCLGLNNNERYAGRESQENEQPSHGGDTTPEGQDER